MHPAVRAAIRAAVVLVATALSTVFFGVVVPLTLLALKVLPSLSVAGVIYLVIGGAFGLVFGAWSSAVSQSRSGRLASPYCARLVAALSVMNLAALVAARYFDAFLHV